MKTAMEIKMILQTYNEIATIKGTARALGIAKETVKKYLKRYWELHNGERSRISPESEERVIQVHPAGRTVEFDWGEIKLTIDGIEDTYQLGAFMDNGEMIAVHRIPEEKGKDVIRIEHYMQTLPKKPGALAQSAALRACSDSLQRLYDHHYSTNPTGFLQILELLRDYGETRFMEVLERDTRKRDKAKSGHLAKPIGAEPDRRKGAIGHLSQGGHGDPSGLERV
ncbi:MAG TPA: hypothetical protein PLU70_02150 [Thermotogota bacterium]|nr:hypothetical protein [Thermotogaceae bacterium]HOF23323.1 hypothetical protein [Thermotogota bacterium]HOM54670.1 hypothetical protein [Thermotogota bacterium]HOS24542.1 hypothetical protein [Thermotogota bacterium]HPD34952.1 hypothetical protein [Thermotogota bacterium]